MLQLPLCKGEQWDVSDTISSPTRCVSLYANILGHVRSEEGEHSSEEPKVFPELPGLGLAHDARRGVALGAVALLPVGSQEKSQEEGEQLQVVLGSLLSC